MDILLFICTKEQKVVICL